MIKDKMKRMGERGFTIVEISIASAVFSVILLVALVSFTSIGRIFYKGVSISQTQEATAQIMQDISGNFQAAANISPKSLGNGYNYYCIGSSRYTFNLWQKVDLDATPNHAASGGNFGMLKDTLPGGTACAAPCNDTGSSGTCGEDTLKFNNPVELLGQRMRLGQFDIQPSSGNSNLYNVSLVIAYGDDDFLNYNTVGGAPDYSSVTCKDQSGTQEFCSVSRISTAVFRGLSF